MAHCSSNVQVQSPLAGVISSAGWVLRPPVYNKPVQHCDASQAALLQTQQIAGIPSSVRNFAVVGCFGATKSD